MLTMRESRYLACVSKNHELLSNVQLGTVVKPFRE